MFRSLLIIGAVLIAAYFVISPSFAQDWEADPAYGSTHIIVPDPYRVELTAGGSINVSNTLGGSCRGFVADAPDFNLYYTSGNTVPLAISVNSGADTTLVINGPGGRWYCDDDGADGFNPALIFNDPQSGLYNIWVGTYGASMVPAVLAISEVSS